MQPAKKYRKLKTALAFLLLVVASFALYVNIVNRNSYHMTLRQKVLKAVYPAMMWVTNKANKNSFVLSGAAKPVTPIYQLTATLNDGSLLNLSSFKGKKILLVNTASDCGYTAQYEGLEKLYQQYKEKLVVIGFPSNDFQNQEQLNDKQIASFCKKNFGVTFPLVQKSIVVNKTGQNEIFHWLSHKNINGWNDQAPTWNFCKYLVDETGKLTHFFASSVEPTSQDVLNAISK